MKEKICSAAEAGYHLSKYNLFKKIPEENLIACVNLMRGTYSKLDPSDLLQLYKLDEISRDDSILKFFIKQGIIVNFNEQELLKSLILKNNTNNINNSSLRITIAVTLSCNFNCPYCFEFHNSNRMNLEVQEQIIDFIKKTVLDNQLKKLHITWYGGEPLLVPDIIESLSKKIIQFTDENLIKYSASIVTNGYFLNQKNADILSKVRVTNYQITLDGIKENHDKTRCLINGEPTYDKIIENLSNTKIQGQINIRHNVYNENLKDTDRLKKIILEIKEKSGNNLNYYYAIVINNPAEKRESQMNYLNNKDEINYSIIKDISKFPSLFLPKILFCGAQNFWNLCIDNEGKLYKCWEDIGKPERSFGNIKKWNFKNPFYTTNNLNMLTKYLNSIAILDEECKDCIWLPFCAGGCPSKRFFCNIKCVPYKNEPELFVQKIIEKFENDNKTN